jgi:glycosyltransferase involved in cell wall biosynthesis
MAASSSSRSPKSKSFELAGLAPAVTQFVDISTVHAAASAPPRGVTRVEYNVARIALSLGARLVRFDDKLQRFAAASLPADFGRARDEIRLILEETPRMRAPLLRRRALGKTRRLGEALAKSAADLHAETGPAREELAWLLAYNYEFFAAAERLELASLAHALEPQALCHKFNYWVIAERGKRSRSKDAAALEPITFSSGDKLLSLGAIWEPKYIDSLEALAARGVAVVALIYDMIPLTHASFLPAEEIHRFKNYLDRMLKSRIRLTTISHSSEREISRYAGEVLGLHKEIAVTPLASSVSAQPGTASRRFLDGGLPHSAFVLMTGSFEPRKNQKFVLDIWRTVVPRLDDPPALVFAGGLANASYLQELRDEARDLKRVLFFFNVDDQELAWLYENCLFTIFPSEAEGWGLPITEALDHGKYCLASDNTSLREAGAGLVFHAELKDKAAWTRELDELLREPQALERRAARIREYHRPRSWADVACAMLAL